MSSKREHSHALICGLIYPAFLGAIIYEFFTQLGDFFFSQLLTIAMIVSVYAFDFLYTNDCYGKKRYNSYRSVLDFALVVTVYMGAKAAMQVPEPNYALALGWLAAFKFLNFLWESVPNNTVERIPQLAYLLFAAFYLVGSIEIVNPLYFGIAILGLDVLLSLYWDAFEKLVKDQKFRFLT